MVTITQLGIDGALNADPEDSNLIVNRDPESQTLRSIWIPLAVVRDALPLFVKAQDEIMASEVSISLDGIVSTDHSTIQPLSSSPHFYLNSADVIIFDLSNCQQTI